MKRSFGWWVPLPPPNRKIRLGAAFAIRCLQNLVHKPLRGQNIDIKGVRVVVAGFVYTAFALTMMSRFEVGDKVRCHRVGVDIEKPSGDGPCGIRPFGFCAG